MCFSHFMQKAPIRVEKDVLLHKNAILSEINQQDQAEIGKLR